MVETDMRFPEVIHKCFYGFPYRLIGSIVFDDDKLIVRVVEAQNMFDSSDEHLRLFIIARYMDRDKWFWTFESTEIAIGDMLIDFPSSDDLQKISKLVDDTSDREEHQGDIDPELVEIDIVADPCFITNHDTDIDEYEHRQSSDYESTSSEIAPKPTVEYAREEKEYAGTKAYIRIEPDFFEQYSGRTE